MADLHTTISRLAETFARDILAAIKSASLEDISALSGGGARGGRPRAAAPAAAPAQEKRGGRRGKRGRRSSADLQGTIDAIVKALSKASEGLRSEQLQKTLGLAKKDVVRPLQLALQQKAIKKKGQKRGTTYFAA